MTRSEREAIAVAVSEANGCGYCVNHHRAVLGAVERAANVNHEAGQGGQARRAALRVYAEKLTWTPDAMSESDVQGLRTIGLGDRDILDVTLIASYFNFVNRIALGLGVEFSPGEVHGYRN